MALWVDKYRPPKLADLTFHLEQANILKKLVDSGDFPHLLVSGPPGSGKKTRVNCILRELYGPGAQKVKMDHMTFKTPSNKTLEIATLASNYHVEMNPSDVGNSDRIVVQEVIKGMASSPQLDTGHQRRFKVLVLREVEALSREAQAGLRRTMEKYAGTCRIILLASSTGRLIAPLRSRCFHLRVPAPDKEAIVQALSLIGEKELSGRGAPTELLARIADRSQGNLRKAILMLEAARVQSPVLEPKQRLAEAEWEVYLRETAGLLLAEQSAAQLLKVRERFYELLGHLIPPEEIFKGLIRELMPRLEGRLRGKVIAAAANYEHSLRLGSKDIFHLEAFVARFMSMYKAHLASSGARK